MKRFSLFVLVIIILGVLLAQCESPALKGAKLYLSQGKNKEAKEQLILEVTAHPEGFEAQYLLGRIYGQEGNYEKMNEHYDLSLNYSNSREISIENDRRGYFSSEYNKGSQYVRMGQETTDSETRQAAFENAIKQMEIARTIRDDIRLNEVLAVSYYSLGQLDEAEKFYQLILDQEPDNQNALINLGNMYFNKAELANEGVEPGKENNELYNAPLEYFLKLVEYAPEALPLVIVEMGWCYERIGKYAEALKLYDEVLANDPENTAMIIAVGQMKFETGDLDGSVEMFKRALEKRPDDLNLVKEVAFPLWDKLLPKFNELGEGEKLPEDEINALLPYMVKVVELDEKNAWAWQILSILYAQLNLHDVPGSDEKMIAAFEVSTFLSELNEGTAGAEERYITALTKWKELIKKEI